MCGLIRPIDSSQCVTVLNDTLTLANCDEGKIFCYNSTTRFIKHKLRDNDMQCVAGVEKRLQLQPCDYEGQLSDSKWTFRWKSMITATSGSECWKRKQTASDTLEVGNECDQEFDFQLIKAQTPGLSLYCVKDLSPKTISAFSRFSARRPLSCILKGNIV